MTEAPAAGALGAAPPRSAAATPTAKLTPPQLPPDHVERLDLARCLDEIFGKRLTTVVAGAGYGKSTLLAWWCADVACALVHALRP